MGCVFQNKVWVQFIIDVLDPPLFCSETAWISRFSTGTKHWIYENPLLNLYFSTWILFNFKIEGHCEKSRVKIDCTRHGWFSVFIACSCNSGKLRVFFFKIKFTRCMYYIFKNCHKYTTVDYFYYSIILLTLYCTVIRNIVVTSFDINTDMQLYHDHFIKHFIDTRTVEMSLYNRASNLTNTSLYNVFFTNLEASENCKYTLFFLSPFILILTFPYLFL